MKKKVLSFLVTAAMLISLLPAAALAAFSDVDGHWGQAAAEKWSELG